MDGAVTTGSEQAFAVLLVIVLPLLVIWAVVAADIARQPGWGPGRRAGWIIACTAVWPMLLVYLLIRPQQGRAERDEGRVDGHAALVGAVLDHEAGRLGDAEFAARVAALRGRGTQARPGSR
jgi:hypothetical protein